MDPSEDEVRELLEFGTPGTELVIDGRMGGIMNAVSESTRRITAVLNSGFHEPEEVRELFSRITHEECPGLRIFTPFYCDFGRNLHVGKDVFFNASVCIQDQGGVWIGDRVQIGHHVVIATINHPADPARRRNCVYRPVHIGDDAWIGSNSTVLPGVTIGEGAIIGAGSVVTKDVPPMTVYAGNPAHMLKRIEQRDDDYSYF